MSPRARPVLALLFLAAGCSGPAVEADGAVAPPFPRPTAPGLYGQDTPPGVIGMNTTASARPAMTLAPTAPPAQTSAAPVAPPDPGEPAEVVTKLQPSFKVCFDDALVADPKAGGTVRFDVVLLPTGEVKTVSIKENVGLSAVVVSCAMAVVQKAKFRPPQGGVETHVEIPIQFRPRT
ncbi:MAG: TonB family protein [Polyangiaceae bacterium]